MIKTLLSTALIALATIAAPAHAATADLDAAPSRVIQSADLNLATAQGQAMLDRRLMIAVQSVCPSEDTRDLARSNAVRACRNHARETLVSQRNAVIAAAGAQTVLATR